MNAQNDYSEIASILAIRFAHSRVGKEEEQTLREWMNGHPNRQELSEQILCQGHYEENERQIRHFPTGEAWEKMYSFVSDMNKPPGFSWWRDGWKVAAAVLFLILPTSHFVHAGLAGRASADTYLNCDQNINKTTLYINYPQMTTYATDLRYNNASPYI
ncbi:MAG: hypothetical protein LBN29_10390 [Mediterranea sp.]|jgi:hypothetical protein|nr:hypothetical protein [Mediterranea sp.]